MNGKMFRFLYFTLLTGVLESRHVISALTVRSAAETPSHEPLGLPTAILRQPEYLLQNGKTENVKPDDSSFSRPETQLKRVPRGSKSWKGRPREQQAAQNYNQHRARDPDGYFTTPRIFNGSLLIHNPLYPVTDETYSAYAVMLLSLIVFAIGVVGNLAVMCIVWHNYYLKTTWNCILASLAFWDFLVLVFCLPVVIFNELTKRRLMGDLSCRVVPYVEVTALGVTTFSLCALSIDRFHALTSTSPRPHQVEPCTSILPKLSVVWVGSLLLAIPELLLWQLVTEVSPVTGLPLDWCARRPLASLPEAVYSLAVTYAEARAWWTFGCFFCLPLLFSLACQLLTRHVAEDASRHTRPSSTSTCSSSSSSSLSKQQKQRRARERQLGRTVLMLAAVYGVCSLPEHAWTIGLTYADLQVGGATLALLALIGQFLMFVRAGATPVLVLCVCRSLGRSFMDCCCCCCEECLPDGASSSSSSSSTTATAMSSSPSSPASVNEDKLQIAPGTSPDVFFDKMKDSSSEMAIGTPC
ncbi:G-protein coupled receptor 37-like 1 [Brachyhypopomus gauderio]|uniref:G-protein coupled receptor 37-like 1 n=1 Tax=Brachyhypopomus gauderio TaxID=698409 RepID=UPI00404153A4